MRRKNPSKRTWGILGAAAAALGGLFVYRKIKAAQLPAGAHVKPPPPAPGQTIPDIPYEAGGESYLTLPLGSTFRVVWDPLSSLHYQVQETDSTQIVDTGDGYVRFKQAVALPSNGISQVFVIATDDNDNVVSEHKVTVYGP